MNAYAASRVRPGDYVHFVDVDEFGRVLLVLSDRLRLEWEDDATTELTFDDCEGLELVSVRDLEQEKLVSSRMLQEAMNGEEAYGVSSS